MKHTNGGIGNKANQGCKETDSNEGKALSKYSNESTIIEAEGFMRTNSFKSDAKASTKSAKAPQMLVATV